MEKKHTPLYAGRFPQNIPRRGAHTYPTDVCQYPPWGMNAMIGCVHYDARLFCLQPGSSHYDSVKKSPLHHRGLIASSQGKYLQGCYLHYLLDNQLYIK